MIYLSQLLGNSIYDVEGEPLGTVSDLGIATGEVFPRVTSLAFMGPGKTPFMISWRKYVDSFDEHKVTLKVSSTDLRFSYLQPSEVLVARDLLDKQIVDTRGMRVVRVNDLKLSDTSSSQLRLLGAEVGVRGLLRSLSPRLESVVSHAARSLGRPIPERIIAWNYMDLIERDLSNVKLSVSHKTLDDMHPADIADIIEQLDPRLRGQVFATLDDEMAAEAMAELDDDEMAAELVGGMEEGAASKVLSEMDPDDAADLVAELDYEKAEKLLRLMGVKEQKAVRQLLGYRENTAGRIMTSEFVAVSEEGTVADATAALAALDEDFESVHYVYLIDEHRHITGVVNLLQLIVSEPDAKLIDFAETDVVSVGPEDDQEDVAETIGKYNLLALPVVDDNERLIGIVTVDDALEVLQEEHEEDLAIMGGQTLGADEQSDNVLGRLLVNEAWFFLWMLAIGILAAVTGNTIDNALDGVMLSMGLPLVLRVAGDMVRYVTSFFLEHDPNDKDMPTLAGFAVRGILASAVYVGMSYLMVYALASTFANVADPELVALPWTDGSMGGALLLAFRAAVVSVIATFASAPLYLTYLRRADDAGEETSGASLRGTAMLLAFVTYLALVLYWGVWA